MVDDDRRQQLTGQITSLKFLIRTLRAQAGLKKADPGNAIHRRLKDEEKQLQSLEIALAKLPKPLKRKTRAANRGHA
jgi:hypothetical protein